MPRPCPRYHGNLYRPPQVEQKKSVSFSGHVLTVLIPTKEEFYEEGLGPELWSSKEEQTNYKKPFTTAVTAIIKAHPNLPIKKIVNMAMKNLPDVASSDPEKTPEK